jgi:hypothetical protein
MELGLHETLLKESPIEAGNDSNVVASLLLVRCKLGHQLTYD